MPIPNAVLTSAPEKGPADYAPADVLDFWFPETDHQNAPDTHTAFWTERMRCGMDEAIICSFPGRTFKAATGQLDHWAEVRPVRGLRS